MQCISHIDSGQDLRLSFHNTQKKPVERHIYILKLVNSSISTIQTKDMYAGRVNNLGASTRIPKFLATSRSASYYLRKI